MRELVLITNEVAALMIISAISGFGGEDAILAGSPASLPTAAKATTEAASVNALAAPAARTAAEVQATPRANDRPPEHPSARWLLHAV